MSSTELKAYVESPEPGYRAYLRTYRTLTPELQREALERLRNGRRMYPRSSAAKLLNWLETNGHVEKEKRR